MKGEGYHWYYNYNIAVESKYRHRSAHLPLTTWRLLRRPPRCLRVLTESICPISAFQDSLRCTNKMLMSMQKTSSRMATHLGCTDSTCTGSSYSKNPSKASLPMARYDQICTQSKMRVFRLRRLSRLPTISYRFFPMTRKPPYFTILTTQNGERGQTLNSYSVTKASALMKLKYKFEMQP